MQQLLLRHAKAYVPHVLRWSVTFAGGLWVGAQHSHIVDNVRSYVLPAPVVEEPRVEQTYSQHQVNAAYLQAAMDLHHGQRIQ